MRHKLAEETGLHVACSCVPMEQLHARCPVPSASLGCWQGSLKWVGGGCLEILRGEASQASWCLVIKQSLLVLFTGRNIVIANLSVSLLAPLADYLFILMPAAVRKG